MKRPHSDNLGSLAERQEPMLAVPEPEEPAYAAPAEEERPALSELAPEPPLSSAPEPEAPARPLVRREALPVAAREPPASRSGTIEAAPMPREAIEVLDAPKFHAVNDRELDRFRNLERPFSLIFAAMFAGVFIGTAWPAAEAFQMLSSGAGKLGSIGRIYIIACPLSFGVAIASAFYATRAKSKVVRAVEAIRKRSKVTLPMGHPAGPRA